VIMWGASFIATKLSCNDARPAALLILCDDFAPSFFVGEQNLRLLLNEDGTLTARGQSIIARCDNVANLCCALFRDRNCDSHQRRILGI